MRGKAVAAVAGLVLGGVVFFGGGRAERPVSLPASAPAPASISAPAPASGVYFPETFTLDNGMTVVVVTNRRVPVVTHMVWYKVGSADEPLGKSGIAHFLEHLMFKGTPSLGPGLFSRQVARNGGKDNAFTGWDYTVYFQNVAVDRLRLVMEMEADRMTHLRLTDDQVNPERDVVREERRQRIENTPKDRLSEQLGLALYTHHPYGTPIIGYDVEIAGLTTADAEEFYRTWYAPNNAVLIVSGDIDAAQLRPLAEATYGRIPARAVPERTRTRLATTTAERRVILRDASVQQAILMSSFIAPSYSYGESEMAYPLEVLGEIMGGGATGRLWRALVVEKPLATATWFEYSPSPRDMGGLDYGATPVPGVDMTALESAVQAEIARLLRDGVTAEEVDTARKRLQASAIYARDSLMGPAYAFGMALTAGRSVASVEEWPARIGKVTVEDVNAAARAVLGRGGAVTGLLLPAEDKP